MVSVAAFALDYRMSPQEMIRQSGCPHVDTTVTPRCFSPGEGQGVMEMEAGIFHFDRYIPSREAIDRIQVHDPSAAWQPARIEHLIFFGKRKPREQMRSPICALGSVSAYKYGKGVPCLDALNSSRALIIDLCRWQRGWEPHYRFLAYRPKRKSLRWLGL